MITKNIGQTSVFDDLKMLTPSVFITNEISEGLLLGHKKPPGIACLEYSLPWYISFIDELGLGLALSKLQKLICSRVQNQSANHRKELNMILYKAVPLNFDLNCPTKSVVMKYSTLSSPWQYIFSTGIRHIMQ